jgi:hypothetical protein
MASCFKYSADGKTEVPDAGFAAHPSRISRDSTEFLHLVSPFLDRYQRVFEKLSA